LAKHFGRYEAIAATQSTAAVPLDAALTANENLADVAGVAAAYDAYRAYVDAHDEPPSLVDGVGNHQLFFVAYAQTWRARVHPALAQVWARSDPHAPPHLRVNAALAQVPAFAQTFACREGSAMRAATVCSLW
jgi:predicted metalloendopeptidase